MKTCGECGLFCPCGALWPSGLCLPSGKRLVAADAAACVCWEEDWRGVDQSDGEREKCVNALLHECVSEKAAGVHGEGASGAADPVGAQDVRKPEYPRAAGVLFDPRFKQAELF